MTTSVKNRLTQKQEAFCLFIFQGCSQRDAYLRAGYTKTMGLAGIDVEASRLLDNPKIALRIGELRQKAEDAAVGTVIERKKRLTEIYRANLTDFVDVEGNITLKPSAALAEVVVEDWKGGQDQHGESRTRRLKLRDPIAAIGEHNKMERIGTSDNVLSQNINIVFVIGKGYLEANPQLTEGKNGNSD